MISEIITKSLFFFVLALILVDWGKELYQHVLKTSILDLPKLNSETAFIYLFGFFCLPLLVGPCGSKYKAIAAWFVVCKFLLFCSL